MPPFLALAWTFLFAHWQLIAFSLIVFASILNRLLPGHPYLSGAVRQAVALLAFTPMTGARSAAFALISSKVGDGMASDFFDWLSHWLDIPLLSKSVPKQGMLIEVPPPRGSARLTVLAVLAVSCLAAAAAAHADEQKPVVAALPQVAASDPLPDPAPAPSMFGGCTASGKLCFAPSIAISIAAINLTSKQVEGAFSPGVGYGFTFNPGKWSSVGLDAYFIMSPAANQASGSILAKFFNGYVRIGISKGFIGDRSTRVLLGPGIDIP